MKILIISHMYPKSTMKVSGVFVHEQAKELVAQGHEVRVVSPIPYVPPFLESISAKWSNYKYTPHEGILDNVQVFYPRYVSYPKSFRFHKSGKRMYSGINHLVDQIFSDFQFDLIHAHTALPAGAAAVPLSKKYNVPLITTIHGVDFEYTIHRGNRYWSTVKDVLTNSSKVVLVSNKLYEKKKNYFPSLSNEYFKIINNGVSELYLSNYDDFTGNTNENEFKIITVLSVSSLIDRKGIKFNIMAINKLLKFYPNIQYKIIGDGEQRNELENLVKELGIEENVKFLGSKSNKELVKYFDECDIFALPSWNEAFGVVYIEALARGKVVIGCKGEGVEETVEDNAEGLLVPPKDSDSIFEKLKYLIENPEIRYKMGVNGRKKVTEKFTWKKVVGQLIEVYYDSTNSKTK